MLSDSCMIATFTGKMWHGRKYDDEVSKEIAKAKDAKKKAGRYNKVLMPDNALLKQIRTGYFTLPNALLLRGVN